MREARPGDGLLFAPLLRPEDRAELKASTGVDAPALPLEHGLYGGGFNYVAYDDVGPFLLGGCSRQTYMTSRGPAVSLWLVASDGYRRHARWIARNTRPIISDLLTKAGALGHNYVDERNTLHIRWLKWAGAEFTGTYIIQADQSVRFLEFFFNV